MIDRPRMSSYLLKRFSTGEATVPTAGYANGYAMPKARLRQQHKSANERVVGKTISTQPLMDYIHRKYADL